MFTSKQTTKKLNFRIHPDASYLYEQVTFQVTPIQERQSSPAHPRRPRTASSASSGAGSSIRSTPLSEIEMRPNGAGYWSKPPRTAATREERPEDYLSSSSSEASEASEEETFSTNERLLVIAFISFMSFSLTQMYFAFRAESEAMKGDSAAMIVDSLTYLFNLFAERRKRTFDKQYVEPTAMVFETPERARQVRQRTKRKVILQYEILPPLLSVVTLVIVTAVVLREAMRVIWLDMHRNPDLQSDPDIHLMMMFSIINLGLDGINFMCFARGGHLFGYDTTEEERAIAANQQSGQQQQPIPLNDYSIHEYDEDEAEFMNNGGHHHHQHANLNMVRSSNLVWGYIIMARFLTQHMIQQCSAYTHVFADTLRSIAVIIAAALSEIFDDVTAEEADAAAALVVSLLIILSLLPLFQGMVQSVAALWAIRAEERSEAMSVEIKEEEKRRRDEFWDEGKIDWS